jgi:hypothetical protein
MKIVHGLIVLTVLVLIGGIVAGISFDFLKFIIIAVWVLFGIELISWTEHLGKDQNVKSERSTQA